MEFAAMYPDFQPGENLVGARKSPVELREHSRLVYMPHTYGPGVMKMTHMESDDFPENGLQVWDEHFLFLTKRAETRQPSPLILNLGGPYESSPRDRVWQDWALRTAAQKGLSFFYDGLNPRSGIGGESPFSPLIAASSAAHASNSGGTLNNTGGLFLPGWTGIRTAKLHALAAIPSTRLASVLRAAPPPPPPPYRRMPASPAHPPPPPPPPEPLVSLSTPALAVAAIVVLALAGQLGLFSGARCANVRAKLDGAAPGPLRAVLALIWALLGVPLPSVATAEPAALPALPVPKAKRKGAGGGGAAGAAERGESGEGRGARNGRDRRGGRRGADGGAAADADGEGEGDGEEDEGESTSLINDEEGEHAPRDARSKPRSGRERHGGGGAARSCRGAEGGAPAAATKGSRAGGEREKRTASGKARGGKDGSKGGGRRQAAADGSSEDEEHQPLAASPPHATGHGAGGGGFNGSRTAPAWDE
jgi:hypothetical protein